MNLKGKSLILRETDDVVYKLVSINNIEKDKIEKLLTLDEKDDEYITISDELKLANNNILAYGKGNPSESMIKKLIFPVALHGDKKVYPCFCNQIIDVRERERLNLYSILHEDAISSFNCARERLLYPDNCVILKINKNGKENVKVSNANKEEV